jgi:hypothetical protein
MVYVLRYPATGKLSKIESSTLLAKTVERYLVLLHI